MMTPEERAQFEKECANLRECLKVFRDSVQSLGSEKPQAQEMQVQQKKASK